MKNILKKMTVGLFVFSMIFGGAFGGVSASAKDNYVGTIGQLDFNLTCRNNDTRMYNDPTPLAFTRTQRYNFATYNCETRARNSSIVSYTFKINWDWVCRDKYGQDRYAVWKNCYYWSLF